MENQRLSIIRMKIIVISDTHIPDRAPSLPEDFLKKIKGVDLILHAGDLVDLSVMEELQTIAPVKAVWGNMDGKKVKEVLKQKEIIKLDNLTAGLMHGWGSPNNLIELLNNEFKNDKVDIIIFGHSHNPINTKRGDILFFNPGSLTDTFFSNCASYGVIEINKNKYSAKIEKLQGDK